MISSIAILVFSTALFIFYVQTLCEKVLRREFSRAYFQDVLNALDLEFPRLRQALSDKASMSYAEARLALKCDYTTLTYLIKNGNPEQRRFTWQEKLIIGYFRFLFLLLPVHYALHFREAQSVVKLTEILHHFANLVGERVSSVPVQGMATSHQA
jgi:hypothetical protein